MNSFSNYTSAWLSAKLLLILVCLFFFASANISLRAQTEAKDAAHQMTYQEVIAAVRADKQDSFDFVINNYIGERGQFINSLLDIFRNPKSSNFQQCASAYFLGEMHATEAIDALASNITLFLGVSDHISILDSPPAVHALVEMGAKSIPAVIRNLEEKDEIPVRDFSLQALYRIEEDKDVVQLRLQKALSAQKDSQKKARLQLAIKALGEPSFPKPGW